MAKIGFGTYRVTDLDPQHIEALKTAIQMGVELIDTSTNYMDATAELAISKALGYFDESEIKRVKIISKAGYIQGSLLKEIKDECEYDDVVRYDESVYHCISPAFLHDQLTLSLQRMGLSKIEAYLLHNPEYYILDALKKEIDKDEMLDEMLSRILDGFTQLEKEVKEGRIKSYGISSNSFSLDHNDDEFLPYIDLVTLAENAAKHVGNEQHSFRYIELPINILETKGLECAAWAKENGLTVLANRPLNAQINSQMYRLAEYEESRDYYHYLNDLLELTNIPQLSAVHNLLGQLDEVKHKFRWIGDYENFLYAQILPHIQGSIEKMDEDSMRAFIESMELFFAEYEKMVMYECGKNTKIALSAFFKDCKKTLQKCAIEFLQNSDDIDYILVGMRKESYLLEILA